MMGSPCGGRWTVGLVMVTVSCLARTVAGEFADYYDLMDYTGYDYSYDSDYGFVTSVSDCEVDAKSGKSTLNGTACDLNVSGDDLTVGLKGGITGIYRYQACQNGRPYYKRDDIKGQVRVVSVAAGFCHPRTPSFEPRGARGARGRRVWYGDAIGSGVRRDAARDRSHGRPFWPSLLSTRQTPGRGLMPPPLRRRTR